MLSMEKFKYYFSFINTMTLFDCLYGAESIFGYDKETDGNTSIVKFRLAGYNKENIKLTSENRVVYIDLTGGKYEGKYKFYIDRGFSKITAKCKDGILEIRIVYPEPNEISIE